VLGEESSPGQVPGTRHEVKEWELNRRPHSRFGIPAIHEHVIDRDPLVGSRRKAESARRVPLRIQIDDQCPSLGHRDSGAQIYGGRGLTHAALLVGDGNDAGHANETVGMNLYGEV